MPPKPTTSGGRGRPKGSKNKPTAREPESSNPFASSSPEAEPTAEVVIDDDEDEGQEKTIPKELLTRVLHEFFAKDATRISRDANAAVGKYVDVFVREAIARAAVEKKGGFLEVSCVAGGCCMGAAAS